MNVENLKKPELMQYAESLGCAVNVRDTVEELKQKISAATGTDIEPTVEKIDNALAKVESDGEKELTVIFHPGQNQDTGNVYFGLNGVAMSLPRNKEVKVKKKYLDMLSKECVGSSVVQKTNEQGKIETIEIKKPVYTFDIVG